jgi:hypothetical protein
MLQLSVDNAHPNDAYWQVIIAVAVQNKDAFAPFIRCSCPSRAASRFLILRRPTTIEQALRITRAPAAPRDAQGAQAITEVLID